MRYIGGKTRLASSIAKVIAEQGEGKTTYVEPFMGGGSVAAKAAPMFKRVLLNDASPDLMLMWAAAQRGQAMPLGVSEQQYNEAKDWAEPSYLRGFIGYGCSFGGKWFGGYARGGNRDYSGESARNVARIASQIKGATLSCGDYEGVTPMVGVNTVVYCDPPYAGTQGYAQAGGWDPRRFWLTVRQWADKGAVVLVSEYSAPEWAVQIAEFPHKRHLQGGHLGQAKDTVERVFKVTV